MKINDKFEKLLASSNSAIACLKLTLLDNNHLTDESSEYIEDNFKFTQIRVSTGGYLIKRIKLDDDPEETPEVFVFSESKLIL